jgi:hypothetical protein
LHRRFDFGADSPTKAADTELRNGRQPEEMLMPIAGGKSDCASLDSSDSWDKVAKTAEKLRNDAGRK